MKKIPSLPKTLRLLFGAAQLFIVLGASLMLVVLLAPLASPRAANAVIALSYSGLLLKTSPNVLHLKTATSGPADIQVSELRADLELNLLSSDPQLANAVRAALLPELIFGAVASYFFLRLLRRLCHRIENGEVLSDANLRAVRHIGFYYLLFGLAYGALKFWADFKLGVYLVEHTTFSGIKATLATYDWLEFSFFINDAFTGLLILLLSEAFRQGLALKQENDLTV